MRRADSLCFMAGWYAFPGGGVNRSDAEEPVSGVAENALGSEDPAAGTGRLQACAIRELFEEIGILLTQQGLTTRRSPSPDWKSELHSLRQELLESKVSLSGVAHRLDVTLDASRLVFAGRWITPPSSPVLCWRRSMC